MLKRIIFAFLIIFTFTTYVSTYALADEIQLTQPTIQPFWTRISTVCNSLDIDSSGKASMISSITAQSGMADSVEIYSYLQRYENGSWVTVNYWSQKYTGTIGNWAKSYYVVSGYQYRLLNNFYAYYGSLYESTSLISNIVGYYQ